MKRNTPTSAATTDEAKTTVPLVSILCRTINRPELAEALASVAAQDHSRLELVLVDASGRQEAEAELDGRDISVQLLHAEQALNRPQAANMALDAATGDYLLFLDEDDWIAPGHIRELLAAVKDNSALLSYSKTQKADARGRLLAQYYHTQFDRALLFRDNYLPIHSVLFSRELLKLGCRFDERFEIYEDWDFWLQCAQHCDFVPSGTLGAFYREGGSSATDIQDQSDKYRTDHPAAQARARLFDKWKQYWSGEDINAMLGTLDHSSDINRLESEIEKQKSHIGDLTEQLNNARLDAERLREDRAAKEQHITRLEQRLQEMHDSLSWKLTRPLRWKPARRTGGTDDE